MAGNNQQKQNHFYWRAGFGPTPEMVYQSGTFKPENYFDAFAKASEKKPLALEASRNPLEGLANGLDNLGKLQQASEEEKKAMRQQMVKQSREELRNLNLMWFDEMVESPAQLREKMSLFWHGHFACRNLNSYYQQQLLQVIREGALGNFADLLREVSKSAAMLAFLNNQQNRKQQPNENFAREVMELFTMGRGNYSETDVKEAARAFTGWGFAINGEFQFRKQFHDTGSKTVLGKTGNFDGDDILNILLDRKETATFVCRKLYRYLVNDTPDEEKVKMLSKHFYESGYDIQKLLKKIYTSDWFYDDANIGARIKSPVDLWVGIRRILPMQLQNPEIQLLLQRALGQILFYPPSVAGWSGGKNWIDSSSLMLRMRIPQMLAMAEPFDIKTKSDDDVDMGRMNDMMGQRMPGRFKLQADIQWEKLQSAFQKVPAGEMENALLQNLLQTKSKPTKAIDEALASLSSDTNKTLRTAIAIMCTPEYQLC